MACSRDLAALVPVQPDRPAGGGIEAAGRGTEGSAKAPRFRPAAGGEVNNGLLGAGEKIWRGQEMPERRVSASPRRRRDAAATRQAILEASTRRFATHGYEHAGVREIAADAGVTAALVNRYFGSKEGLFAEVIERAFDMQHLLPDHRGDLAEHLARV